MSASSAAPQPSPTSRPSLSPRISAEEEGRGSQALEDLEIPVKLLLFKVLRILPKFTINLLQSITLKYDIFIQQVCNVLAIKQNLLLCLKVG